MLEQSLTRQIPDDERLISALLNCVCPNCGGVMMEFRCIGECGRNWRREWDKAQGIRAHMCRRPRRVHPR